MIASVFSVYMVSAAIWLLFSTAVGLLVSFKFAYPDFATAPALSFGRLRAIHTNGTFYAWASQALIGLALFIAARNSGTRLYSPRLAWGSLALLNLAAVLGTITLDLGFNYGQEYRERVCWIRIILGLGLITAVRTLAPASLALRYDERTGESAANVSKRGYHGTPIHGWRPGKLEFRGWAREGRNHPGACEERKLERVRTSCQPGRAPV